MFGGLETKPPVDPVDWDAVLERIENGEVPSEFCLSFVEDMPSSPREIERKAKADSAFATRLTEAKKIGAAVMMADCLKIADAPNLRADQKKIMIDTRMKLCALIDPAFNPKTIVEQHTTISTLTEREQYIKDTMEFCGLTREQAAARWDREAGVTVQ